MAKTDISHMVKNSCFIKPHFGVPGNSRSVDAEPILTTDADKRRFKVQKTLLDSPQLKKICKSDFQMRAFLYRLCHKFVDGIHVLPLAFLEQVDARLTAYFETERPLLVADFLAAYPQLCADAVADLGSQHNPKDYPSAERMAGEFESRYDIFTFTVPDGINPVIASKAKASLLASIQEAALEITALMRGELLGLVDHLQEKLTPGTDGKPRILRDSAVKNVFEWLEIFDGRNITNDVELAGVVGELRGMLNGVNGDKLRNSDLLRDKLRGSMDGVRGTLSTLVTEKAGRVFRDE